MEYIPITDGIYVCLYTKDIIIRNFNPDHFSSSHALTTYKSSHNMTNKLHHFK